MVESIGAGEDGVEDGGRQSSGSGHWDLGPHPRREWVRAWCGDTLFI